ncbi:hypothetical protein AVEN_202027-1 [Araneus ventricosus]|uniref:Uncharacterized protein n=1 Tax=Araneus ventricosus TaxID=182803 RepID=A0A4Y2R111_ARAVE|nr:hypothetical protein AVEN_202027-1 [Araneus ventricosus]
MYFDHHYKVTSQKVYDIIRDAAETTNHHLRNFSIVPIPVKFGIMHPDLIPSKVLWCGVKFGKGMLARWSSYGTIQLSALAEWSTKTICPCRVVNQNHLPLQSGQPKPSALAGDQAIELFNALPLQSS